MMTKTMRGGLWLGGILVAFVFTSHAWAHGGLTMDKDTCKLRIGPFLMHFTGYQPQKTTTTEFCEDIPNIGQTIVVLDYIDDPLRDMSTEVRIIKDTGSEDNLDEITVFRVPPKVYPTGSLHFEYNFEQPGKYVGLVTVRDKQEYVSRFPFSVGTTNPLYGRIFYVLLIIVSAVALYLYSGRKKKIESQKPA